jgi:hypothetical protein
MHCVSAVAEGNDLADIGNVFTGGPLSSLAAEDGRQEKVCDQRSLLDTGSMRADPADISGRTRKIPNEIQICPCRTCGDSRLRSKFRH